MCENTFSYEEAFLLSNINELLDENSSPFIFDNVSKTISVQTNDPEYIRFHEI